MSSRVLETQRQLLAAASEYPREFALRQIWKDTPWWSKAITTGLIVGFLPVVINEVDGKLWVSHNFELVLLIMFPTTTVLATVVALPMFYASERRAVRRQPGTKSARRKSRV